MNPELTLSKRGQLIITQSGGESFELYAAESNKNHSLSAALLDTGNFVVRSNGEILWQSFDHPTDSLLPGMKLGVNHRTGRNWTLSSCFGQRNPASGAFTLEWDPSVRNLIVKRRGIVYWTSGELKDHYVEVESGNLRVKQFENFPSEVNIFNLNYNLSNVTSADEEYFTYSLIIDPTWIPEEQKINYDGDIYDTNWGKIVRPSLCYGYKTEGSSVQKGCALWAQPKCRNNRETFDLMSGEFRPVDGLGAPYVHDYNSSLSSSDCREICWNDCECVGYFDSQGTDGCVYRRGKNLEFDQSLDGSAVQKYVLVSTSSSKGMKKHAMIILVIVSVIVVLILGIGLFVLRIVKQGMKKHAMIILVIVSVIVVLILGIGLFVLRIVKQGKREEKLKELLTLEGYTEGYELENGGAKSHDLRLFTYASIQSATSNFCSDYKLGQGGFGAVYKGKTQEGQDIAVKVLSQQSGQGLLEFKTELILISKLQQVNLVKLQGFCIHGDDKMIIYDYMPNKSLDFFLFNPSQRERLDWNKRFNIIEGIAQGLLYLHKHSRLKIIHRDLKPSNILLDESMTPKISDFGLARIFKQNIDEANTNRRVGTYGYMAPEYAMQGIFSVKSDVYSFGVLVLEIVSDRKNNCFHQIEGPLNVVEYAWELWRKGSALELMDPTLRDSCVINQLQRCIHIGLLCVENQAVDRPTIEDVIFILKNETASLPMPKNPAFITRNSVFQEVEKSAPEKLSANELTLSEIGGR
ncbi:Serine/threonine protein kinase [Handroanthus impetiginosus]|uniref:Receptor-like serine/threonine-protein kinase n=1 Tax=Handroanthus impetiginosus TaxID=429701 RepID=A0A2G9G8A6_9LAMI|nr:Serine/threonine protein kinase [Handroanthus impetiginosus]